MMEELHKTIERRSSQIERLAKAFNGVPRHLQLARMLSQMEIDQADEFVEWMERDSHKDDERLLFNFGQLVIKHIPATEKFPTAYYAFGNPSDSETGMHYIPNTDGYKPLYDLLDVIYKDLKGIGYVP